MSEYWFKLICPCCDHCWAHPVKADGESVTLPTGGPSTCAVCGYELTSGDHVTLHRPDDTETTYAILEASR